MSAKRSPQRRRALKNAMPFRALMTQERNSVLERLQLFGDFPDCKPPCTCDLDWLHVLMLALADAAEYARLDSLDAQVIKSLKRQLAITAAACEMWVETIEKETK